MKKLSVGTVIKVNRRNFIDHKKDLVTLQLQNLIDEIDAGNIIVVEPKEDTPILKNGIKVLLKDDSKIEEIARRIWGF
jgi:hypothetical protein